MIDTSAWKEFRVGDLFDIHPTKAYKLTNAQLLDDGDYPVIANSAYNNGIGGYSTKEPTEKGNMVTFSDTVDANTIFYQPNDFVGYPHVQGLYPLIYEDKWNEYTYSFFVSVFKGSAISKGFDYGNKFRRDIAVDLIIKLPATSDGQPDWDYMESYMKTVMEESEKSLENLRKADDTKHLIDVSGWGEFSLSELVDEYYIAKSLDYGHLQEGNTAFINRSQTNNGIQGYVKADAYEKPNCITIGMIGNSKHAFWQTVWFVASQNILVLRNSVWNDYSASFICGIINSLLSDFQDYKDIIKKDDWVQNTKIKLPITSTGEPDWQYMEDYMRRIMDKSEQIISDLQIGA